MTKLSIARVYFLVHARPEEGTGGPYPHPLENYENIGFLSNAGPDPLEKHKATKPAFNVGPSSALGIETQF